MVRLSDVRPLSAASALAVLGLTVALAQTPELVNLPAAWTHDRLSQATFVIADPEIRGNAGLVNDSQRAGILKAMRKDSGDALKRRYPRAVLATGSGTTAAIRVTPVMEAPSALRPWSALTASLTFDLPEGATVIVKQRFSVLTLWQQGSGAANYAFDQIARRLP